MQAHDSRAAATLPNVLAVCVNWNGRHVLPAALGSLLDSDYPNLGVVVVDCASKDGSPEQVTKPVQMIELEQNRGYAAAINAALLQTEQFSGLAASLGRPDYFLFLNNDVEVEPDLVSNLVAFAASRQPCVCGPLVLIHSSPRRLEASWGKVDWSHVLANFEHKNRPLEALGERTPRQVELLLGSALLADSRAVESVGLWDETYFLYHEEVDWLYRCRLAGVGVYFCPFVSIRHHGGAGTRGQPLKKTYWLRRNTVYFFRKHGAGPGRWAYWGTTLAASFVFHLVTLRWRRLRMMWKGVVDGFRLRPDDFS